MGREGLFTHCLSPKQMRLLAEAEPGNAPDFNTLVTAPSHYWAITTCAGLIA
jgi:hypothetical protein